MTTQLTARKKLIIWIKQIKDIKKLKRYGFITYVSKTFRYVCLYVDAKNYHKLMDHLAQKSFVIKVKQSKVEELELDFDKQKELMESLRAEAKVYNQNHEMR
ncbi:DUF2129 domain-containing protein [Holzapfeliella sp. He02]|uniref:DUF2129 domain-containing protein n=1 Tax=Holzapfeliella saturejae TaxID=3082953 RepID=A0ABU8SHE8_9LACO